jgi:hypothetical protein
VSSGAAVHVRPDLPIRVRRAIRARVQWLAQSAGRTEVAELALTLCLVRATDRARMTTQATRRLVALERLLVGELDERVPDIPTAGTAESYHGMQNMANRARMLDADLQVRSSLSVNTTIELAVHMTA